VASLRAIPKRDTPRAELIDSTFFMNVLQGASTQ